MRRLPIVDMPSTEPHASLFVHTDDDDPEKWHAHVRLNRVITRGTVSVDDSGNMVTEGWKMRPVGEA